MRDMRVVVVISFVLIIFLFFGFTSYVDSNEEYIHERIEQVGGTVIDIKLDQHDSLHEYDITYLDKNGVKKKALYLTKLGVDKFMFIEE